jgi:hypothetical protein
MPFLPLTDEDMVKLRAETPHLEEVYLDQRDAAFLELEGEELESLDEKGRADYEAAFIAVDDRIGEKERVMREEEERRDAERRLRCDTPRDKDENRCAGPTNLFTKPEGEPSHEKTRHSGLSFQTATPRTLFLLLAERGGCHLTPSDICLCPQVHRAAPCACQRGLVHAHLAARQPITRRRGRHAGTFLWG